MAYRPAYKPAERKRDPVRSGCLSVAYFGVLAVIAYGLFLVIDSRFQLRQLFEVRNDIPDVVIAVVASFALWVVLHLLVLFGTSLVRGAKVNDTRP